MKAILVLLSLVMSLSTWAGPRVIGNGFVEEKEVSTSEAETNVKATKTDKINYPYIDDFRVTQGQWCSVDFVDKIDSFKIDQRISKAELYLKKITFLPEGNLCWDYEYKEKECQSGEKLEYLNWTRVKYSQEGINFDGIIMHKGDSTASGYLLKNIKGQQVLFLQHKSGNYKLKGKVENYFVFRPCSSISKK